MKSLDQILDAVKNGKESQCLDGRDFYRLAGFFPADQLVVFKCKSPSSEYKPEPFSEEVVLGWLKTDVAFGFEKALNHRGISSEFMFEVVKMWMWVLDDSLQYFSDDNYPKYGLPLFKAVAIKYNLENPIGTDLGSEEKYEEPD